MGTGQRVLSVRKIIIIRRRRRRSLKFNAINIKDCYLTRPWAKFYLLKILIASSSHLSLEFYKWRLSKRFAQNSACIYSLSPIYKSITPIIQIFYYKSRNSRLCNVLNFLRTSSHLQSGFSNVGSVHWISFLYTSRTIWFWRATWRLLEDRMWLCTTPLSH
jgi:hypothetical protein